MVQWDLMGCNGILWWFNIVQWDLMGFYGGLIGFNVNFMVDLMGFNGISMVVQWDLM